MEKEKIVIEEIDVTFYINKLLLIYEIFFFFLSVFPIWFRRISFDNSN